MILDPGHLGRLLLQLGEEMLAIGSLPFAALKGAVQERRKSRLLVVRAAIQQLYFTAVEPLPLFVFLGVVIGFVVAAITHRALGATPFAEHVPMVIGRAVVLESIPLVISLVLTGRSGTAVATELGYMRVNNQVDALEVTGINIEYFVVLPRLVGITAASVTLTIAMGAAGIVGGIGVGKLTGFIVGSLSVVDVTAALEGWVIGLALLKALAFGLLIATINCHFGLSVGRAFTDIPRANAQGAVRCYLGCVGVNALVSIWALTLTAPLPVAAM